MAGLYFGAGVVVAPLFLPFLPCRLYLRTLVAFLPDFKLCLWWVLPFLPVPAFFPGLPPVACAETEPARARNAPSTAAVSGLFLLFIHPLLVKGFRSSGRRDYIAISEAVNIKLGQALCLNSDRDFSN
jgi:hypothetical protein